MARIFYFSYGFKTTIIETPHIQEVLKDLYHAHKPDAGPKSKFIMTWEALFKGAESKESMVQRFEEMHKVVNAEYHLWR